MDIAFICVDSACEHRLKRTVARQVSMRKTQRMNKPKTQNKTMKKKKRFILKMDSDNEEATTADSDYAVAQPITKGDRFRKKLDELCR